MAAGKALRATALAALAAGAFLSLAAADLGLRSRGALLEAEKYEAWAAQPALKAAALEAEFGSSAPIAAAGAAPEAAERQRDLLAARREFAQSQSPAKLAYIWYKTAAEDFYFPGNPWAAKARARLPGALAAWRAELAARGISAEAWMTN